MKKSIALLSTILIVFGTVASASSLPDSKVIACTVMQRDLPDHDSSTPPGPSDPGAPVCGTECGTNNYIWLGVGLAAVAVAMAIIANHHS